MFRINLAFYILFGQVIKKKSYIPNLRFCDIVENGVWNFNMLYTQLPLLYQDQIRNVILDIDTDDKLIWSSSTNRIYSTRQDYIWLECFSNQHNMSNICWKWIWHLRVSENLMNFCWLVMHGSLPTNALRCSRHLTAGMTYILFVIVLDRCLSWVIFFPSFQTTT